jgi:hypothetical protein
MARTIAQRLGDLEKLVMQYFGSKPTAAKRKAVKRPVKRNNPKKKKTKRSSKR